MVFLVTKAFLPLLYKSAAPRFVNLSSGLGSLTNTSFPPAEGHDVNALAYNSSKTALNALTVQFANELRPKGIKVNLADPGYTATDMTNHLGANSPEEAARTAVRLALLGEDDQRVGTSAQMARRRGDIMRSRSTAESLR
ncbi:MAG TPA: SDR family NAD(P)-dependent oxidoreductase [Bryobacteraceae bacterium]|nr:SDR family NAD(P)-dependent oxidoreductase [Bryobacteraceae bacterium]